MTVTIKVGHVLDELAKLPAESVHCIWTSIPYWGLRSYGTEPQVWGGDIPGCAHEWGDESIRGGGTQTQGASSLRQGRANVEAQATTGQSQGCFCRHCNAWRGEHGLEPTLDLWLAHEVLIWRELWRVLRSDGTAWLNVGDAYATTPNGRSAADQKATGTDDRTMRDKPVTTINKRRTAGIDRDDCDVGGWGTSDDSLRWRGGATFKAKDRLLMPHRLAIALHAEGWWIRDEIVLAKKNPMPSSVKDRTCSAHEMLFMLTKRGRYFYDHVAVQEPITASSETRYAQPTIDQQEGGAKQDHYESGFTGQRARSRRPNEIIKDLAAQHWRKPAGWATSAGYAGQDPRYAKRAVVDGHATATARLKRSVWSQATEPYPGAHFATAPTGWVRPCILAGTSARGVCPNCGAPWIRTIKKARTYGSLIEKGLENGAMRNQLGGQSEWEEYEPPIATGWSPSCSCPDNVPIPATVLDPFGGAGTTGLVADELGRDCILIELNPTYAAMARDRLRVGLAQVETSSLDAPLIGGLFT